MGKNLVISLATNYSYYLLDPFVRSLDDSGFDGDFVLFYDNLSGRTLRKLRERGVILKKFDSEGFKKKGLHIMHYRFMMYYEFLKKSFKKYDNILIADVRDVFFQKDPFVYENYGPLNLFAEELTLEECSINSHIFELSSSAKELKKYSKENILCAGTTIGTTKGIMDYLKKMTLKLNIKDILFDQGYHNYLFYAGKLPGAKKFHNLKGPVLTLAEMGSKNLKYNNKRQVINLDGSVVNILHQYDRDLGLLYRSNKFGYFLLSLSRSLKIKIRRGIKISLFRLPLLGRYFRKKYYDPTRFK